MKRRRSAMLLLCGLLLLPVLSGCWGARELNALSLVMGIGIDKDPSTPEKVHMTAQIVRPEALKRTTTGESGQQAKAYWNLKSSGATIFDAIREYTHVTNNKLYDAHNEVIIFGRDAAQDGVVKYLDFFQRAQETRPTTEIVVSMTTAADALDVMPELDKLPAVNIAKLVKAQEYTSQSREVMLQEFTNNLLSKTECAIAPLAWVTQGNGEKQIAVKGLAVFKRDRMVGQLDENEARGLLWVEGRVKTGSIDLPYENGQVSLEIKSEKTKVSSQIKDGKSRIIVNIQEEGVIVAQTCTVNIEKPELLTLIENLEQTSIEREILATVKKAQQMNTDVFGFGEEIGKYHPSEWRDLEGRWDEVFPSIQVEVNVKCMIRAAGNIIRPDTPQ